METEGCQAARVYFVGSHTIIEPNSEVLLQPVGGELSHAPIHLLITYDLRNTGNIRSVMRTFLLHTLVEYE